jgi:hypothetical protein
MFEAPVFVLLRMDVESIQPLASSSGMLGLWRASPPMNRFINDVIFGVPPKECHFMIGQGGSPDDNPIIFLEQL